MLSNIMHNTSAMWSETPLGITFTDWSFTNRYLFLVFLTQLQLSAEKPHVWRGQYQYV